MAIISLPGIFLVHFVFFVDASPIFYLLPVAYLILIQMLWYYYTSRKWSVVIKNHEFQEIVRRAQDRLGYSAELQLFVSKENGLVLANARTPFLRGLLSSDRAVKAIAENPTEGEVVIAYEIARLRRTPLWLSFLYNLIGIGYGFLIISGPFFFELIQQFLSPADFPLWILAALITYPWGLMFFVWYYSQSIAEREVEEVYGRNPNLAAFEVFSKSSLSEDARRFYLDKIGLKIDERASRSVAHKVLIPFVWSCIVLALSVFAILVSELPQFLFVPIAVLLGGAVFSILLYVTSSKGFFMANYENYGLASPEEVHSEKFDEVRNILQSTLHTDEIELLQYDSEYYDEFPEVEVNYLEFNIQGVTIHTDDLEIQALNDPGLIASYLMGLYIEEKSAVPWKAYAVAFLITIVLIIGGLVTLFSNSLGTILASVTWIIIAGMTAPVFITYLNRKTHKRQDIALASFMKTEESYLTSLTKLVDFLEADSYGHRAAKKRLERASRLVSMGPI